MTVSKLADADGQPPEATAAGPQPAAARANLYVARMLQQHLVDEPAAKSWSSDGSAVLVDISGFTKLSEALARKGREGAEQITELIGHIFELMLAVAYDSGGSLLKFGGDALLLWFEGDGHAVIGFDAGELAAFLIERVDRDVRSDPHHDRRDDLIRYRR